MTPLFVVLQDSADPKLTIYPQVHYIYSDDVFSPAADIMEQQKDDISLLVDVDEQGQVIECSSLSPNWQVLSYSTQTQNLQRDLESKLLLINGTKAHQPADIPDLDESYAGCVESARKVVAQLERRNDELRIALQRAAEAHESMSSPGTATPSIKSKQSIKSSGS